MEANTDIREYSIAVVAMQGRFPDAENVSQFWENLKEGRDSIKPIDMDEIRKTGKLSDEDSQELKEAISSRVADYLATLG